MIKQLIIISSLILSIATVSRGQQVAKGFHQVLLSEEEEPTRMHIKVASPNIDIRKTPGTRLRVSGKVKISIPNLYFLEYLIKQGRYELTLTPSGDGGLVLEDKNRTPIILKGEKCAEDIFLTVYVPLSVSSILIENTLTGDSNIVNLDN